MNGSIRAGKLIGDQKARCLRHGQVLEPPLEHFIFLRQTRFDWCGSPLLLDFRREVPAPRASQRLVAIALHLLIEIKLPGPV
jgi:hypothetical protein